MLHDTHAQTRHTPATDPPPGQTHLDRPGPDHPVVDDGRTIAELRDLPICFSTYEVAKPKDTAAYGRQLKTPWSKFAGTVLRERREGPKDGACMVLAELEPDHDGPGWRVRRQGKNLGRRTAVVLDIEVNKTTGEVPPPTAEMEARIKTLKLSALLYTSHSHQNDLPRYRIVCQLSAPIAHDLPVVEVVADLLGVRSVLDTTKIGAASAFYLPSMESGSSADHHTMIDVKGRPIDVTWLEHHAGRLLEEREAAKAREREAASAEAAKRRQAKAAAGFNATESIIEAVRNHLDLEAELIGHNYERAGEKRFLYSGSESGIAGVYILAGTDGIERIYSHHASDPLAAGNLPRWCGVKAIDVVDLKIILDFGGDRKKGLHAMAKQFNLSGQQKASQRPPEPPPADEGDYGSIHTKPARANPRPNGGAPSPAGSNGHASDGVGQDHAADGLATGDEPPPAASGDLAPAAAGGGDLITEDSVALAFAEQHSGDLRYCHHTGSWFQWREGIWRREETDLAFSWARKLARETAADAGNPKTKLAAGKASFCNGVEHMAQSDRAFAVTSEIWDRDLFLLGTPDGTVDLRTGILRPARREDFITKCTAVAPAETADCPQWLAFLRQVTNADDGLIRFLQQWFGYSLTGDISEHALLFAYGPGRNGKGVMLNTMGTILGDYTTVAPMETFVASANDHHPTDLAMLRGARLVIASETEEGRYWAESRIKQLTGGDPISARFMRQDFFTFTPQFKLTIIGNHKPMLRNVDDAIKYRFNMAPFLFKPAIVDRGLENKLRAEWPGILRWAIDGCLDWQRNGLVRPDIIAATTANYFETQNTVQQWMDECCDLGPTRFDTRASLFKSWTDYAVANGEKPGTSKWFSQTLEKMDCQAVKHTPGCHKKRGFIGISVKQVSMDSSRYPD